MSDLVIYIIMICLIVVAGDAYIEGVLFGRPPGIVVDIAIAIALLGVVVLCIKR